MKKEMCALILSLAAMATSVYLTKDVPSSMPPAGVPSPCPAHYQPVAAELMFLRMGPLFGSSNPLGLSDAQIDNIDQIMDLFQSTTRHHLRRIDAGRELILALVRQDKFDEEAAQAIASGLTNEITELMVDQEHLEAMIGAELRREQKDQAGRILQELDELLGTSDAGIEEELTHLNARICEALSLSKAQKFQLEKIIGSEHAALRPTVRTGQNVNRESTFPAFNGYFHETEARSAAQPRAAKMADVLVSTGRGMARLYCLLNKEQKKEFDRREDELESQIRDSLLLLQSSLPDVTISNAFPSPPLL
ncbi:hypothetical protein EG829_03880 [bacterium]|nr:hypothetical protein [bacterium]